MSLFKQTRFPAETVTPRGNTDTGLLKLLALAFMIVDHVGAVFFPRAIEMRFFGRIAFPLYIWCAVVGCCYTRSFEKYIARLLIVGVISQPCFMLALGHEWYELNVFFTLLLGVIGVAGIRMRRAFSQIWAPVAAVLIGALVEMDYGWKGVLLVILVYQCRGSRGAIGAVYLAFCLFWGQDSYVLSSLFGLPLYALSSSLPAGLKAMYLAMIRIQFFAVLSLPFILIPTKGTWRMPKAMTYAAYPAHLLVIGVVRLILQAAS